MKKQLLFASALLIGGSSLWAQSQRFCIVEHFTQASCGPCAQANPAFQSLMTSNATKVMGIRYQVSWPGTDPMNAQNKTEVASRVSYYGIGGVPDEKMDGTISNVTSSSINTEYAVKSPFTMNLWYQFNAANDSINISCTVTASQAVTLTTPKLQVAMVEKTITFTSAPGSNGEKVFYNVMRKMYPDASGTTLPTSWTNGQAQTFTFKAKIPTYIYKKTEIAVVAWVQDNTGKKIQQAVFSTAAIPLSNHDVNALSNSVSVYPNPSNGIFTAYFDAKNVNNYTVKVTNALGQIVYKEALNDFSGEYSKQMDISSFGQGVYMFSVSSSDGEQVRQVINY
ncbi:MAG TPA: Omp28-related outer membrane protein [Bacteroidia bacterium]|nr:Omp28-related outer membrane protein [Bacteroidia bacterium]